MPPTKDLFASSSDDDDDELAQQLAMADAREKRRDPHAFTKFSKRKGSFHGGVSDAQANAESGSDSDSEAEDPHSIEEQPKISSTIQKKKKRGDVKESKDGMSGIRINKQYAAKYEVVKREKELRQLTEKYGNRIPARIQSGDDEEEEEDDEEGEDDNAVLLTEDKEIAFAKAFLAIRSAVPGTGERSKESEQLPNFFPPVEDQLTENNTIFMRAMKQKEMERRRRFTLADEYRRGMTGSGAMGEGDEKEKDHPQGNRKIKPLSGKEQQLRESFLKNVADSTETFSVQPVPDSNNSGEHTNKGKSSIAKEILVEAFSIRGSNDGKKKKNNNNNKSEQKKKLSLHDDEDDHHNNDDAEVEEKTQSEGNEDDGADEAFIRDYFVNELWKPSMSKSKKQTQKQTQRQEHEQRQRNSKEDLSPGSKENEEDEEEEEEEEPGNNYATLAQLEREEEDERFYADAEAWEREYQDRAYRHQDEAAAHIQSFPRPIGDHAAGLLRQSAGVSVRKEARLRRMQRMEEARQQQVEELKRLKKLKRKEIESQRTLIAAVAGLSEKAAGNGKSKKNKNSNKSNNDDNNKGAFSSANEEEDDEAIKRVMALWSEKDLDEDFDPKEFDKKMAKLFDEEYYDEKNVDEDEIAFFDEEIDQEADEGDDDGEPDHEDNANEEGERRRGRAADDVPDLYNAQSLEEAILMSASANANTEDAKNRSTADNHSSAAADPTLSDDPLALLYPSAALRAMEDADFRHATTRPQPPTTQRHSEDRGGEALRQLRADLARREKEYCELHHGPAAGGGGAARTCFQYREVPAEDFLLPVEEILARDDRQLNMIVPMSCYAAYLDAEANSRDRASVARRAHRGFRELDVSRRSRRYGDVAKTALVDMNMSEAAGQEWADRVRDGLRRSRAEDDLEEAETPRVKRERKEVTAEKGIRGRGRGAPRSQHAERAKWRQDENDGARQSGRGRGRGR